MPAGYHFDARQGAIRSGQGTSFIRRIGKYVHFGLVVHAVRAESLRREGLIGMTEAVDEYVKIMVGAKLAKRAVDRYSEE